MSHKKDTRLIHSNGDYDKTNWTCVHFVVLACQNKSPLSDRVTVRKFCSLRDIKQTSVVFCPGDGPSEDQEQWYHMETKYIELYFMIKWITIHEKLH